MNTINQIKHLYQNLTSKQKHQLLSDLKLVPSFQVKIKASTCPYCNSKRFIKHGRYKGTMRYKCKSCNRTFLPSTGTSLHYINKRDCFIEYAAIIKNEGLHSLDYMAKRLNISITTAFDWRHKILLSIPKEKKQFVNEVQCDDLWFLYSQKGRKGLQYSRKRGGSKRKGDNDFQSKLITASDSHQVEMKLARIGRITKDDLERIIGKKIRKDTAIISDGHSSYSAFAKEHGLKHHSFVSKMYQTVDGKNLQYINNMSERLKTKINRIMRGVSTKYLQLYANYFAFCEKHTFDAMSKPFLNQKNVWIKYAQMENIYENFIRKYSVRTYRCPVKRRWKKAKSFLLEEAEHPY